MTKHSGLNKMLLVTTLASFTLGLASTVGVPGVFGGANEEFQAPRVVHPNSSFHENDPIQAPRGRDVQAPRVEVGRGVSDSAQRVARQNSDRATSW